MRGGLIWLSLCALIFVGSARAETGVGQSPRATNDILETVDARPLGLIGPNSFRFSSQPSLGGRGYIFEIVANERGGRVQIIWLHGHPRLGWQVTRRRTISLTSSEVTSLLGYFDEVLAEGEPQSTSDEGEMIVCMDGPGYLSERAQDGAETWMSGFCPGVDRPHPNQTIANWLLTWWFDRSGH